MGIDALILVNITDYFFGLRDRLWGRLFLAPKVVFPSTRMPPSCLWNSGSRLLCLFLSVQGLRWSLNCPLLSFGTRMAYSSPYLRDIVPSSILAPFWWHSCSPQPLVLSLSTLVGLPSSWFLLLLQNSCVPGGSSGASHPSCVFLFYSLAGSLSTIVWIVMHFGLHCRLSKACFQLNKPKEGKQLRPLFLSSHYPSQQGGWERMHPLGPERMSNIRPFSISYTA